MTEVKLVIKWRGSETPIDVHTNETFDHIKDLLSVLFDVPKANQKLLGPKGKLNDHDTVVTAGLKDGQTLTLIGSTTQDLQQQQQDEQMHREMNMEEQNTMDDDIIEDFGDDLISDSNMTIEEPDEPTKPTVDLKAIFKTQFDSKYTDFEMSKFLFVDTPFDQAFDAAKREYKILMSILYAGDNENSVQYAAQVLTNEFAIELIQGHFILWIGDTNIPRNMQSLKNMLSRNMNVQQLSNFHESTLPMTTMVSYFDNSISVIDILEGSIDQNLLISKMLNAIEVYGPLIENQRAGMQKRESETQSVLSQQDQRYEEALRKDRERERLKREEEERLALERAIEDSKREQQVRERERKMATLPAEPEPIKGTFATIKIRLLDGTQLSRRFKNEDTVRTVFDYMDVEKGLDCKSVELVSNFPKISYDYERDGDVLVGKQLAPQANLFVKEK
jgi:hypothetical protein